MEQKVKNIIMNNEVKSKIIEADHKKSSQVQTEMNFSSQVEFLKEEIYRVS